MWIRIFSGGRRVLCNGVSELGLLSGTIVRVAGVRLGKAGLYGLTYHRHK